MPIQSAPRALAVIAVVVAVAGLKLADDFVVPLLIALVVALALGPVVRWLSDWMPRALAAGLVVVTLAGAFGGLAYSLSDEAAQALVELPKVTRQVRQALRGSLRRKDTPLAKIELTMREMERAASDTGQATPPSGVTAVQVVEPALDLQNYMWWGSRGLASAVGGLVIGCFLVFFMLATGDRFKRKLVRLSGPTFSRRRAALRVVDGISNRVARYLLHMTITSTVVGVVTWLAFAWIGLTQPGLWGLAAGLLNLVPYFGPTLVMVGSALAAFVQFGDAGMVALVAGTSLVITGVEGMLVSPILLGPVADVNPVAVFVSFLFWGWLWGPLGVLLAMPMLVIVKTVAESVPSLAGVHELLAG